MSSPRESKNDFSWGEIWRQSPPSDFDWGGVGEKERALNADLARQVRIMISAGKGMHEISSWLQKNGLSPQQANEVVAVLAESRQSDWWERLCGRSSLVLIGILSAAVLQLVVVKRPWDEARWTWKGGIPAVVGFALFGVLYAAAMGVLWYLATRFGGFLDRLRDKHTPRGLWVVLVLTCLLTVLALVALFAFG